ncbi:MAG: FkbM family methyltransferase [Spirulina sp. SIO3F2]|nr:FkbM family methyltransferase [Spirulina sp. SIO3F2]
MKKTLQRILKRYPTLYQPLRNVYRTFTHRPIWKHFTANEPFFFVQIGSNDGLQGDAIHNIVMNNTKWRGLLVEPVPFLFERLKNNYYRSDRFIFENVAIAPEKGVTKFYYVSESAKAELGEKLPEWFDQLGSLDRAHIFKHLPPDLNAAHLDPYIIEAEIESLTMPDLLARNQIETIDLLHIDTEGFDYKILSQIDFKQYHPRVVLYEHIHLPETEKMAAESLLKAHNYCCSPHGRFDTLALRQW